MIRVFNKAAHVGLGMWSGWTINDPKYRHGGWAFLVSFLFYQGIEAWRKQDQGWPETREFMTGMGAALLLRRALQLGRR